MEPYYRKVLPGTREWIKGTSDFTRLSFSAEMITDVCISYIYPASWLWEGNLRAARGPRWRQPVEKERKEYCCWGHRLQGLNSLHARLQMVGVGWFPLVFVCWTLAGSSGLCYWPPGDQLTSLTGPDPGSPSASLSADDRRIAGIQPQGSPSLIPRRINFTCMCIRLSSPCFPPFYHLFFRE